jgi:hypothetical protein
LASTGWCVIQERLQLNELKRGIGLCILYLIADGLITYITMPMFALIIISVAEIASLFLYVRDVLRLLIAARRFVRAWLVEITKAGIDPVTTPVWYKRTMFRVVSYAIFVYGGMLIAKVVVLNFATDFPWLHILLGDLADFALVASFGIVWRLQAQGPKNGYFKVQEEADLAEVAKVKWGKTTDGLIEEGGKVWEIGMVLPPPPGVRQKATLADLAAGVDL